MTRGGVAGGRSTQSTGAPLPSRDLPTRKTVADIPRARSAGNACSAIEAKPSSNVIATSSLLRRPRPVRVSSNATTRRLRAIQSKCRSNRSGRTESGPVQSGSTA